MNVIAPQSVFKRMAMTALTLMNAVPLSMDVITCAAIRLAVLGVCVLRGTLWMMISPHVLTMMSVWRRHTTALMLMYSVSTKKVVLTVRAQLAIHQMAAPVLMLMSAVREPIGIVSMSVSTLLVAMSVCVEKISTVLMATNVKVSYSRQISTLEHPNKHSIDHVGVLSEFHTRVLLGLYLVPQLATPESTLTETILKN